MWKVAIMATFLCFMADYPNPGTFSYSIAGTNTLTDVTAKPTALLHISVAQNGGSAGFLQIYNNGSANAAAGAGTPDFAIAVPSGTQGAGTPATRDINYGPFGRELTKGLSYLWAAGPTGTVAHGVNATVDITYTRRI